MNTLAPLETLHTSERGPALPLPPDLAAFYGRLDLPPHPGRPAVIGNFVSSLDGVVALESGTSFSISGNNAHDQAVMGLLRAIADAVIVGAGTLRSVPRHRWTPAAIYPDLADAYQQLRAALSKPEPPLQVIVSAQGNLDLSLPVFQSGEAPALIVTTTAGADRLSGRALPSWVRLMAVEGEQKVSAGAVLNAVEQVRSCQIILTEGGPLLLGDFFAGRKLDELFLTLAPQVAGRDASSNRPGFAAGVVFAPEHPLWGTLVDIRRAGSYLFLRYAFAGADE
jgi:riboflavin biosynthesis pyrimidine reductase